MKAKFLIEATKYDAMFKRMIDNKTIINTNMKELPFREETRWARLVLKKEPWVVWYIKYYRLFYLTIMKNYQQHGFLDRNQIDFDKLDKVFRYYLKSDTSTDKMDIKMVKRNLEHYFSLGLKQIQDYNPGNQTPEEVSKALRAIEMEWQDSIADDDRLVSSEPQHTTVIKFPDKSAWWNLNTESCRKEADAMGHCGNFAAPHAGDTILSYRKPVNKNGQTFWIPCLTFILNDGFLGEMKGRANEKPAARYHLVIEALLLHPIVQGIIGGGYQASSNFSLDDLGPARKAALLAKKPELGGMVDFYKKYGKSEQTLNRLLKYCNMYDLPMPEWHEQYNGYVVKKWPNVSTFVNDYAGRKERQIRYVVDVLSGNEYLDNESMGLDSAEDLYHSLSREDRKAIEVYAAKEYKDDFEDEDEVEDLSFSTREMLQVFENNNDPIWDSLNSAHQMGIISGTESNMSNALKNAFDRDLEFGSFHFSYVAEDQPLYYTMTLVEICKVLDELGKTDGGGVDDWFDAVTEILGDPINLNINEPSYGWTDYDSKAAKEYLQQEIQIP